jgi:hypothetical protein
VVTSETLRIIRNFLAAFESEGLACEVVEKNRELQLEVARMPPHPSRLDMIESRTKYRL